MMNIRLALVLGVMVLVVSALPVGMISANPGWDYYKDITINGSKVSGTVTSFPVLISLASDSDLVAHAQSDGGDIVFTDQGNTMIYDHEIESYNSGTGALVAWVEVDSLTNGSDKTIRMWYGNAEIEDQWKPTDTWDSSYVGVWHLKESSGTLYDSTSNDNDATANNGVTQGAAGKIATAADFDGSDDHLSVADAASLDLTTAASIEAWVSAVPTDFVAAQQTSSAYWKYTPCFQVVGDTIYYVWSEYDGSKNQIWTATMGTDGTGWSATKRTTSATDKFSPQLQVVGETIYYVWDCGAKLQIWTATMGTDGTGWSATQRTTSAYDKQWPQLQVVGSTIYYAWSETDSNLDQQIWTASMGTDGSGWSATERTSSRTSSYRPQLQVVGSNIHYVYYETKSSDDQIWTAVMNTDGTGWTATKRTASGEDSQYPQLQVVGTTIHYVYQEFDGGKDQLWTATMGTDGTGWTATKRTSSSYSKDRPQLQVVGDTIYYVWEELDTSSKYQIWTGTMTIGGFWSPQQRTTSSNNKYSPELQLVGTKVYYGWYETISTYNQICTAEDDANFLSKGDAYGLGLPLTAFIDGGPDMMKYGASAVSYSAGAAATGSVGSDWRHLALTYGGGEYGSTLTLYLDGSSVDTASFGENIYSNPFPLIIGDDVDGGIDEVRVSSTARAGGWITTSYNNQSDTTIGADKFLKSLSAETLTEGVDPVPELPTIVLLGMGLAGLVLALILGGRPGATPPAA